MAARTFAITAGPRGRLLLSEAIRSFAHAAYPPGGSDCAQVARETLMTTATHIQQGTGEVQVRTRQRVMLRQAVQWYCENLEQLGTVQRAQLNDALQALLRGEPMDDANLAAYVAD
jgi:hypothetical protein